MSALCSNLTYFMHSQQTSQKLCRVRAPVSHKKAPGLISYSYGPIKHKRHSNVMLFCRQHGVIYLRAIHNFLLFTLCWFSLEWYLVTIILFQQPHASWVCAWMVYVFVIIIRRCLYVGNNEYFGLLLLFLVKTIPGLRRRGKGGTILIF